ncbi:sushi, von Willebrand factor type A, EGF and pentraxin domain-containing protein 1-like isoform X5 [Amphiura filiformis]|uniref:sushi, von Willebrand factor type A, EGF and pentraxin domain-containing protein 1-like isoform X5 n=1 Tax=Amphiura filiformis TaxID=82378 RepID=UPI003B20C6DC
MLPSSSSLLLLLSSCATIWNFILAAPDDYGFITAGDSLYNISMDTQVIQKLPISGLMFPAGIDYDPVESKIYWAEYWGNKIGRCNFDGTMQELNFITNTAQPYGVVLDVLNRWIYWSAEANVVTSVLERARLDGSQRSVIASIGPASPRHIALDSTLNKIYWTDQYNHEIKRINADGTGPMEIIVDASATDTSISGIALDIQAGLLFWCDWKKDTIEVYDFGINQIRIIYQSSADIKPYALALYGQNIYWVESELSYLQTVPKIGLAEGAFPQNFGIGSNIFEGAYGIRIKSTELCNSFEPICRNGGTCFNEPSDTDSFFSCQCTANYRGRLCETFQEIPKCATPIAPLNGFISSSVFSVGTVVTFICLPGYVIVGATQATCKDDLTWSVVSPTCVLTCPILSPPANGAINPSQALYFVGDQVTFTCDSGYQLVGLGTISCTPTGQWSSSFPTCSEIVTCPQPVQPPNGFVSGQAVYTVGATVTFTCMVGYEIVGADQATCREDLTWSVPSPYCARSCRGLTPPLNGFINPPIGPYLAGQQLTFSCNTGYRLVGLGTIMCTNEGEWSSTNFPLCSRIVTCPPPPLPENGQVLPVQITYDIDQTITFQCNNGYQLFGSPSAVCLADGSWSEVTPTCQTVSCVAPPAPIEGSLQPEQTSYSSGQQVNFQCNEGYQIPSGQQSYAVCTQGGSWSSQTPSCSELTCDPPLRPDNVKLIPDQSYYGVGHEVSFSCHEGYAIFGHETALCMLDGSWSNSSPTCHEIACLTPDRPFNGDVSPALASYSIGQMVEYHCHNSFVLRGERSSICLNNGLWSSPTPICQEVTCLIPAHPSNGFLFPSLTIYAYGQQVTFQCSQGFQLVGEESATCVNVNTWSNASPACEEIICSAPSQPQNGGVSPLLSSYEYNQQVNIQCYPGFYLTGEPSVSCVGPNTWSSVISTCEVITCTAPAQPQNGFISPLLSSYAFQQPVMFACNSGFHLVGESTATCSAQNTWSSPVPLCREIRCGAPAQPQNGNISPILSSYSYQQEVSFSCNVGYFLNGDEIIRCTSENDWSASFPTCSAVTCSRPQEPQNGYLSPGISTYAYQQEVTFRCSDGFELIGDPSSMCVQLNTWSNPTPSCAVITCASPGRPTNGQLSPDTSSYRINDQVRFQCNTGYQLIGQTIVFCLFNGMWSNETPMCEQIICSMPVQPTNGMVIPFTNTNRVGTQLTFMCQAGYQISGSSRVTCTPEGIWSSPFPRCVQNAPTSCINPPTLSNGNITPTLPSYIIGTALTYSCSAGYDLQGSAVIRCTTDGSWSAIFPTCMEHVSCPTPDIPEDGGISPATGSYDQGQQVVFNCDSGFQLRGVPAVVCQQDGSWSKESPFCLKENCPPPDVPENGKVVPYGNIPFGLNVTFECDRGFRLEGTRQAMCLPTLIWNMESPMCIAVTCATPIQLTNGNIEPVEAIYTVNAQITYSCNPGYRLMGMSTSTCDLLADDVAIWSPQPPLCVEQGVVCDQLTHPRDGSISPAQDMPYPVGERVTFQCNSGFELQGKTELYCTNDGSWSGIPPICEEIALTCPPVVAPTNGYLSPSMGPYPVGQTVDITCHSGYVITGTSTIVCTLDGNWSDNTPSCSPFECNAPEPLLNGFITPNVGPYTIGFLINFSCKLGFTLLGPESSVCTNQQLWSEKTPICYQQDPTCITPSTLSQKLIILPDGHDSYAIGEVVEFACQNGFVLNGKESAVCTKDRTWSEIFPTCVVMAAEDPSFLAQEGNVRLILWIGVPVAFVILLVFTVCCIIVFRRHRRGRLPTDEELIMEYRKENQTLPAGQGTDVYNIYGQRDNRPRVMMRQQPAYATPHMNNLNQREEQHYQSSLQRSHADSLDSHSLPRSIADSHQSIPRSNGLPAAESSLPSYVNVNVTNGPMNQLTRL